MEPILAYAKFLKQHYADSTIAILDEAIEAFGEKLELMVLKYETLSVSTCSQKKIENYGALLQEKIEKVKAEQEKYFDADEYFDFLIAEMRYVQCASGNFRKAGNSTKANELVKQNWKNKEILVSKYKDRDSRNFVMNATANYAQISDETAAVKRQLMDDILLAAEELVKWDARQYEEAYF